MTKKMTTYTTAFNELKETIKQIENNDIPIDELLIKVKRCSHLLKFCKEKLHNTEKEVQDVLSSLDQETTDEKTNNNETSDS